MGCKNCGGGSSKMSFFTQGLSSNQSAILGNSAAIGVSDGTMPALPAAWLNPAIAVESAPWFERTVKDGVVNLSVQFPHDKFRRLTINSLEKVISSTDRAIFLAAYPELFQEPKAIAPPTGRRGAALAQNPPTPNANESPKP
jgi:hypothetical protein